MGDGGGERLDLGCMVLPNYCITLPKNLFNDMIKRIRTNTVFLVEFLLLFLLVRGRTSLHSLQSSTNVNYITDRVLSNHGSDKKMVRKQLPLDVLLEILCRLPVKSLKRFECVSKSWCEYIRNPNFVTQHLQFNNRKKKNDSFLVLHILNVYDPGTPIEEIGTHVTLLQLSESTEDIVSLRRLSFSNYYKDKDRVFQLIGPRNGIYCLYGDDGDPITLVNVGLREFKVVPNQSIISSIPDCYVEEIVGGIPPYVEEIAGFGFDPTTKDFKLVLILKSEHPKFGRPIQQAAVYSLSSNSWKKVDDILLNYITLRLSVIDAYVNNNVHWFGLYDDGGEAIVSFNMVDEVFRKIKLPKYRSSPKKVVCEVAVYNESLSVIVYPKKRRVKEKCFDVWVMQDYNDDGSWTKQLTVGPIELVDRLLGFWRHGQFILEDYEGEAVVYDPSSKKTWKLLDGESGTLNIKKPLYHYQPILWHACVYSESLISMRGYEQNEQNTSFDIIEDHPWFTSPDKNCMSNI